MFFLSAKRRVRKDERKSSQSKLVKKLELKIRKTRVAGGRESKVARKWRLRGSIDDLRHGHLRRSIRFKASGATAKPHESSYISVDMG